MLCKRAKGIVMIIRHTLNLPLIYFLFFPLIILDFFLEIYHRIGFRLCKMELVKRSNYIKIDRHKLSYLPWRNKLGCVFCGYANGFLHYASEIAARSEKYWCGIKHKPTGDYIEPKHHEDFVEYNNEEEFRKRYS